MLSKKEIEAINLATETFIDTLSELGVDSAVVLYSYRSDNRRMERRGIGNPFAQNGMISDSVSEVRRSVQPQPIVIEEDQHFLDWNIE